jgi:hypothetical protein
LRGKGRDVTIVRNWRLFSGSIQAEGVEGQLTGNYPVLAGYTLVRSILTVQFWEFLNVAHFPPLPPLQIACGYYQAINTTSLVGLPTIGDGDHDWVCYGVPQFFADFGVTSAVQSDLCWQASISFDVKSERKALVANPSFCVAFGRLEFPAGGLTRNRSVTMTATLRALWQHSI